MQFSAQNALIKARAELMSELDDWIGMWTATTSRRDLIMKATPWFLSPELAYAIRRTPRLVGT